MNVLLKRLYLLQCIPLFILKCWHSKKWVVLHCLTPYITTGLLLCGLFCTGVTLTINLHHGSRLSLPNEMTLLALLSLPLTSASLRHSSNSVVRNCLKIWTQLKRHFGFQAVPLLSPVHSNPRFPPFITDEDFTTWENCGSAPLKHL